MVIEFRVETKDLEKKTNEMLQKAQIKPRVLRRVVRSECVKTRRYIIKDISKNTKLKRVQAGKRVYLDMKRAGKVRKKGDTKRRNLFHAVIATQKTASIAHIGRLRGRAGVRTKRVSNTGLNIGGKHYPLAYYYRIKSLKGDLKRIYHRVDKKPKAISTEVSPLTTYEKKGKRLMRVTAYRIIKSLKRQIREGKHYGNKS